MDDEGDYTPSELFDALAEIYSYLFLDVEPARLHTLRLAAASSVEKLTGIIRRHIGGGSRVRALRCIRSGALC